MSFKIIESYYLHGSEGRVNIGVAEDGKYFAGWGLDEDPRIEHPSYHYYQNDTLEAIRQQVKDGYNWGRYGFDPD